jgi:hypothetical protein
MVREGMSKSAIDNKIDEVFSFKYKSPENMNKMLKAELLPIIEAEKHAYALSVLEAVKAEVGAIKKNQTKDYNGVKEPLSPFKSYHGGWMDCCDELFIRLDQHINKVKG